MFQEEDDQDWLELLGEGWCEGLWSGTLVSDVEKEDPRRRDDPHHASWFHDVVVVNWIEPEWSKHQREQGNGMKWRFRVHDQMSRKATMGCQ